MKWTWAINLDSEVDLMQLLQAQNYTELTVK